MNVAEQAIVFDYAGEQLVGVLAQPDSSEKPAELGVLIVVGGPQYRVGSHRQFLLLSRRIAEAGFPVFRFDYRGMGDSSGDQRDFEVVSGDIGAAVGAFLAASPSVRKVVLWGLCDAASASLIYIDGSKDSRVAGLILLNPWVRSEATLAQTHVKHYYGKRLLQKEFWRKFLTGKLEVARSLNGLMKNLLLMRKSRTAQGGNQRSFQSRMAMGWKAMSGHVLLILSGQDYTAMEFLDYASSNSEWSSLIGGDGATRIDFADADHTFSGAGFRAAVENASIHWLSGLGDRVEKNAASRMN